MNYTNQLFKFFFCRFPLINMINELIVSSNVILRKEHYINKMVIEQFSYVVMYALYLYGEF